MNIQTYSELKEFLFDRQDSYQDWYFSEDFVEPEFTGENALEFISELYQDSNYLKSLVDESLIYHGLTFTMNTACSDTAYLFVDEAIAESIRLETIDAIYVLYRDFFNTSCNTLLSSIQPKIRQDEFNPRNVENLNSLCYMWWDNFPRHGIPHKPSLEKFDMKIMECLEKILKLGNIACKESALHGLSHWTASFPEEVQKTIINNDACIPEILKEYAQKAFNGSAQ